VEAREASYLAAYLVVLLEAEERREGEELFNRAV
jgi:hypothetical protein